jgi:hypothetical protein
MNNLQSNIITLKQRGMISGVDLKPLSSGFFDLWNTVNQNSDLYKISVTQTLPNRQVKPTTSSPALTTTTTRAILKKQFKSMGSDLIASSDILVTQLALQTDTNSNDLVLLQILFAILIVSILVLYLVAKMLKPIFDLTQTTSEINKGNFDVTVVQRPTSSQF